MILVRGFSVNIKSMSCKSEGTINIVEITIGWSIEGVAVSVVQVVHQAIDTIENVWHHDWAWDLSIN